MKTIPTCAVPAGTIKDLLLENVVSRNLEQPSVDADLMIKPNPEFPNNKKFH